MADFWKAWLHSLPEKSIPKIELESLWLEQSLFSVSLRKRHGDFSVTFYEITSISIALVGYCNSVWQITEARGNRWQAAQSYSAYNKHAGFDPKSA